MQGNRRYVIGLLWGCRLRLRGHARRCRRRRGCRSLRLGYDSRHSRGSRHSRPFHRNFFWAERRLDDDRPLLLLLLRRKRTAGNQQTGSGHPNEYARRGLNHSSMSISFGPNGVCIVRRRGWPCPAGGWEAGRAVVEVAGTTGAAGIGATAVTVGAAFPTVRV